MIHHLDRYFGLTAKGGSLKGEVLGGVTTFVTMAYIIVVNPKILEAAGIPFGPSMAATILSAAFGTLLMGVYARLPIAVAPYMGENAFIAYTVCGVLGYSWQTALGAILISGVLFAAITLFGIRGWFSRAIPESLKRAFVVGIGLFLTFIGLTTTGMVKLGVPGAPVHMGDFSDPLVLLAIAGFLLMVTLMAWRVPGAILIAILAVTLAAFGLGHTQAPEAWVSVPPSLSPTFLAMDVGAALTWGFLSVILTVLVMDFVDTMGTLYAVAHRAGLTDENGDIPDIHRPFLVDATATIVAACLGTTTTGAYVESATGVEAGGRTGLTAVVVALLFLLALFLEPFFTAVPPCAYGPSLIVVGLLMLSGLQEMELTDMDEAVPAFVTVVLMSFTYNIGVGMTAGFVAYPVMKVLRGKAGEVGLGMWLLGALSLAFYIFYPY